MNDLLSHVAAAMKVGQHHAVESKIKELESVYNIFKVQELLEGLQQLQKTNESTMENEVYVHFTALKLLHFFLVRDREQWLPSGDRMVTFLLQYGKYICHVKTEQHYNVALTSRDGGEIVQRKPHMEWRPVFQELSEAVAVVLKLRCVGSSSNLNSSSFSEIIGISEVIQGLLNILREAVESSSTSSFASTSSESSVVLARFIALKTIEEFGLFDLRSRRRGVPLRVHMNWRSKMENEGLAPLIEHFASILLLPSSCETIDTLETAVNVLHSALSWFHYRFIDAEDEVAEEKTLDVYHVKCCQWHSLLVGHGAPLKEDFSSASPCLASILHYRFSALQSAIDASLASSSTSLDVVPSSSGNGWERNYGAVNDTHRSSVLLLDMVRCIRTLCSFTLVDGSKEIKCEYIIIHFNVCLRLLGSSLSFLNSVSSHRSSCHGAGEIVRQTLHQRLIPIITTGIRCVIINFIDTLAHYSSLELPFIEWKGWTVALLTLGSWEEEEESLETYWGSVEDALSSWLALVIRIERCSSDDIFAFHPVVELQMTQMLEEILQFVLSACVSCEEGIILREEGMELPIYELRKNCFQLIGRISRISVRPSCAIFQGALSKLTTSLQQIDANGCEYRAFSTLRKAVLIVFHILLRFLQDPSEGENPCIPSCFLDEKVAQECVIPLVNSVVNLYINVLSVSSAFQACEDVFDAYLALLEGYIRVYIDADESNTIYTESFSGGLQLLTFCVSVCSDYWNRFPSGTSVSVRRLLSTVVNKNSTLRQEIMKSSVFQSLVEAVKRERTAVDASSRGRLVAAIVSCVSPLNVFTCIPELSTLLSQNSSSVDLVYNATCLTEIAKNLTRSEALQSAFPSYSELAFSIIIDMFTTHLEDRVCVLCALQLSREMFTSFTIVLDDSGVLSMLKLLQFALENCVVSLQTCSSWYDSNEGLHYRHDLLTCLASFLYDIALWKALDCFLLDEDIVAIEVTTIDTLAFLFENIKPEERKIPEVDVALCVALEHCSNAFCTTFIQHSKSSYFMNAILYAIPHENPTIQMIGVHVLSTVVTYFTRSTSGSHSSRSDDVFSTFFDVLLRAVVHPQTSFQNRRRLSEALLQVSQNVSSERILLMFQRLLRDHCDSEKPLQQLYHGLEYVMVNMRGEENFPSALTYFEDIAQNSVTSLSLLSMTSN